MFILKRNSSLCNQGLKLHFFSEMKPCKEMVSMGVKSFGIKILIIILNYILL